MNRKILAVAAAHAEGGPGAGDACGRRRRSLLGTEGISKEVGLRRRRRAGLLLMTEKEVEQALGKSGIRHGQDGAGKHGGSQQRPA